MERKRLGKELHWKIGVLFVCLFVYKKLPCILGIKKAMNIPRARHMLRKVPRRPRIFTSSWLADSVQVKGKDEGRVVNCLKGIKEFPNIESIFKDWKRIF